MTIDKSAAVDLLTPLADLESVCSEIFQRWDADLRSGKLLMALEGARKAYDPRVDRIRAALSPAQPEWLPIESAPRDGTAILAAVAGGWGGPNLACIGVILWLGEVIQPGWIGSTAMGVSMHSPTHWLPLPLPPRGEVG